MNVIVFAARKGGSGKSTLTAHLASAKPPRSCLLIDADPQASLSLWHKLRNDDRLSLRTSSRNIIDAVKNAKAEGFEWVLIDTPPTMNACVSDAIRAATMVVIPARPTVFDLNAVAETISLCRELRRPYAVVINGAPAKRDGAESPIVTEAREGLAKLKVPLWSGQITNRAQYALSLAAGEGVKEYDGESQAAAEMASLWSAIDKSVKAIRGHHENARVMHKVAA